MGTKTRVSIDTSLLEITWAPGITYHFAAQAGFTVEDGGEQQVSPATANLYEFTTNSTGPVLVSAVPANGATAVTNTTSVSLTFSRKLLRNVGNIELYLYDPDGDILVHTFDATDTSKVTISNTVLTINVTGYVTKGGGIYYFLLDAGVVTDYDEFNSVAIESATGLQYSLGDPPLLISQTPSTAGGATTNPDTLVLTFNKNIQRGSVGNIYLYSYDDPTSVLIHTYAYNDTALTFNNAVLTINTKPYITNSTTYFIFIDSGVVKDSNGIYFVGVASPFIINWITAPEMDFQGSSNIQAISTLTCEPREITAAERYYSEATPHTYVEDTIGRIGGYPRINDYGNTGTGYYCVDINATPSAAIVRLDEVDSGASGYESFNFTTKVLTIVGTRDNINLKLASLVLYPTTDYRSNFTLTYQIRYGTTLAGVGGSYLGNGGTIQNLLIGGPTDTQITNMIGTSRSFVTKQKNEIFATNSPFISDFDSSSGLIYTAILSSSIGRFTTDTYGSDLSATWEFTGTRTEVTDKLKLINFYPNANVTASGTFTYTQKKNGTTQLTTTVDLTKSANGSLASSTVYSTVNNTLQTGSWRPTLAETIYYTKLDINIKGGDGRNSPNTGGGGGGLGGEGTFTNTDIVNGIYTINLGLLGNVGGYSGGISRVNQGTTAYIANGGGGGRYSISTYALGIVTPANPDLDHYNLSYDFSAGNNGSVVKQTSSTSTTLVAGSNGQQVTGSVTVYGAHNYPNSFWYPIDLHAGPSSTTWFQFKPSGGTGTTTNSNGKIILTLHN